MERTSTAQTTPATLLTQEAMPAEVTLALQRSSQASSNHVRGHVERVNFRRQEPLAHRRFQSFRLQHELGVSEDSRPKTSLQITDYLIQRLYSTW
jgi:hypothetical protein